MLAEQLLPQIKDYIKQYHQSFSIHTSEFAQVSYLAQGEYNLNYLLQDEGRRYVLRVNTGSQMQIDRQIEYEYDALHLLRSSEVTPYPYYYDGSKKRLPYGILIMEYLPGRPLDYQTDLALAAQTFACIHGMNFTPAETEFLIRETGPFSGIYQEAARLLESYFNCPQADPQVAGLLERLLARAETRRHEEKSLLDEPWLKVINTEVNSHNFIVNDKEGTCHLIDWEKPILGEPAQDISHFLIATTTLWKQNQLIDREAERNFIREYIYHLPPDPLVNTLIDRIEMFKFFNYLRAVSWCAMAWTEYTQPGRLLNNQDTWHKINEYLSMEFLNRIAAEYLS